MGWRVQKVTLQLPDVCVFTNGYKDEEISVDPGVFMILSMTVAQTYIQGQQK